MIHGSVAFLILFVIYTCVGENLTKNTINKCCPFGAELKSRRCVHFDNDLNILNVTVYHSIKSTGKSLEDVFTLVSGKLDRDPQFKMMAIDASLFNMNIYLQENGDLLTEIPNNYQRFISIKNDDFCIDFKRTRSHKKISFLINLSIDEVEEIPFNNDYWENIVLVSCAALLLIVFLLLRQYRNLRGLILMAFVASLLMTFIFLAFMKFTMFTREVCKFLTCCIYASFLSTFCWINVWSYDTWSTISCHLKPKEDVQGNMSRKFNYCQLLVYILYGYGVPFLMTVGLFVLMVHDMKHLPWFITPGVPDQSCFLDGGYKLLYLQTPTIITLVCSWAFHLVTGYILWESRRKTDETNSIPNVKLNKEIRRFVKCVMVTGIMTVFILIDIISSKSPSKSLDIIGQIYVVFIGIGLLGIFMGNMETLRRIWSRLTCKERTPCSASIPLNQL